VLWYCCWVKSTKFVVGDKVAVNPFNKNSEMMGVNIGGCITKFIAINEDMAYKAEIADSKLVAYMEPIAVSLSPLNVEGLKFNMKGAILGKDRIALLTKKIMSLAGFKNILILDECDSITDSFYDFIIETSATEAVIDQAIKGLKKGGTLILKSRSPNKVPINIYAMVKKEIRVESCYYYSFSKSVKFALENQSCLAELLGESYHINDWKKLSQVARVLIRKFSLKFRDNKNSMCGIFCQISNNINRCLIEKAISNISHRGPDGVGYFFEKNIGIAHNLLSITGDSIKQPIISEDGNIVVAVNGELYGRKKFRC
jgi:hypothetical protein